jgi:hypothetical protein
MAIVKGVRIIWTCNSDMGNNLCMQFFIKASREEKNTRVSLGIDVTDIIKI